MEYIHVKNLEKYHPGYKDRNLQWCKAYFTMINSDPEFEMLEEIDKWRLVAFIMLELQLKKPIPRNEQYLMRKGFNFKKRPISLTLKMLHNFIVVVTEDTDLALRIRNVDKDKEVDKEKDKDKEYIVKVARATFDHYLVLFNKKETQYQYTSKRKAKAEQRTRELFKAIQDGKSIDVPYETLLFLMKRAVDNRKASKFHMGDNPQGKKYIDFVDHIFRSQEYTEQLIFEEKKQTSIIKKPEWFNDLHKQIKQQYEEKFAKNS